MPPWLFRYAANAWAPIPAPWNSPGIGPERVAMVPRLIVSAVTPTSVAPPFPPAGTGWAFAAAPVAAPGATAAVGVPVADATASPVPVAPAGPTGPLEPLATRSA